MNILKNILNVVAILAIIMNLYVIFPMNTSNAASAVDSLIDQAEPKAGDVPSNSNGVVIIIGRLLGFLQIASGLMTVVVISFTGFKYIVEPDPNMKEEAKKKLLPILIGIVLVFSATSVAKFVISATASSKYLNTYDRTQVVQNGK